MTRGAGLRPRPGVVAVGVTAALVAGVTGFAAARLTAAPGAVDSVDSETALPDQARVVVAPGVSDCQPIPGSQTRLPDRYFGSAAAIPVVVDRTLRLWGPRCVISAGLVNSAGDSAPRAGAQWSRPEWDQMRAGPGSADLIELPGVSDCRPLWSPDAVDGDSSGYAPIVAIIGADGRWWGPRCIVSSGTTRS